MCCNRLNFETRLLRWLTQRRPKFACFYAGSSTLRTQLWNWKLLSQRKGYILIPGRYFRKMYIHHHMWHVLMHGSNIKLDIEYLSRFVGVIKCPDRKVILTHCRLRLYISHREQVKRWYNVYLQMPAPGYIVNQIATTIDGTTHLWQLQWWVPVGFLSGTDLPSNGRCLPQTMGGLYQSGVQLVVKISLILLW